VADGRVADGVRLAVTLLTVAPLRVRRPPDRRTAAIAMSLAPVVGVILGLVLGGIGIAAVAAGAPPLVAAVLTIGAGAVLTRGIHLDGLADTVDGLGSYSDPETALAIMRRPDVGPFGVVAIVLVLVAQVVAAAAVLGRPAYAALAGVTAATAAGRLAVALACRRGVRAARPDGLGALVAGTVAVPVMVAGFVLVAAIALAARPALWPGPLAVLTATAAVFLLLRHVVRRLGGITGDVLGAGCETAVTIVYIGMSM
jgi:adenosylcobinamide-GDP ribazoletransferase